MPIILLQCSDLPLSAADVERLWQATCTSQGVVDTEVTIRCVTETESKTLNVRYRGKDAPTNVLTWSYPATPLPEDAPPTLRELTHDITLCLPVIAKEAQQQGVDLASYTARVLVHGFLHAAGLDHEQSDAAAARMASAERAVLTAAGFDSDALIDTA